MLVSYGLGITPGGGGGQDIYYVVESLQVEVEETNMDITIEIVDDLIEVLIVELPILVTIDDTQGTEVLV